MPPSLSPLRTFPRPHSPKPTLFISLCLYKLNKEKKNQTRIKQKKKGGKRERNEKHTEKP